MTYHSVRTIVCTCCGKTLAVPISCGDRFCPICSEPSRNRARSRIRALIAGTPRQTGSRWRLITLTIRSQSDAASATKTLQSSFRKLRNTKWWKANCYGGISTIEVTHTEKGWHAHIHAMVLGRYLPAHTLSRQWSTVAPGSIVDVRACDNARALSYITKYVTKSSVPDEFRPELAQALKGTRLFCVFGALHGQTVTVKATPFYCQDCGQCAWMPLDIVERLINRAPSG